MFTKKWWTTMRSKTNRRIEHSGALISELSEDVGWGPCAFGPIITLFKLYWSYPSEARKSSSSHPNYCILPNCGKKTLGVSLTRSFKDAVAFWMLLLLCRVLGHAGWGNHWLALQGLNCPDLGWRIENCWESPFIFQGGSEDQKGLLCWKVGALQRLQLHFWVAVWVRIDCCEMLWNTFAKSWALSYRLGVGIRSQRDVTVDLDQLRCDKDPNFYYDYVALLSTMYSTSGEEGAAPVIRFGVWSQSL